MRFRAIINDVTLIMKLNPGPVYQQVSAKSNDEDDGLDNKNGEEESLRQTESIQLTCRLTTVDPVLSKRFDLDFVCYHP